MKFMILMLTLTLVGSFSQLCLAEDSLGLDKSNIQAILINVFENASITQLNKLGVNASPQENWTMLLAAKSELEKQWHPYGAEEEFNIIIEPTKMVGGDPNRLVYSFKVRFHTSRFKAPVCLDLDIEMSGNFFIIKPDGGTVMKTIELDTFSPKISNKVQCV
jgi:hypothetical protein